ncbi:MAG: YlxR family protein [Eubacterium sp.]|nr:YlxR family protein [Eubacterium sp.]
MKGTTTNRKIPMRQCVGCGQMNEKRLMYRVIKTPENELLLDKTGRKNGRGAYICPQEECLQKAVKSKGLERSLKMQIPSEVYESLTEEMKQSHEA